MKINPAVASARYQMLGPQMDDVRFTWRKQKPYTFNPKPPIPNKDSWLSTSQVQHHSLLSFVRRQAGWSLTTSDTSRCLLANSVVTRALGLSIPHAFPQYDGKPTPQYLLHPRAPRTHSLSASDVWPTGPYPACLSVVPHHNCLIASSTRSALLPVQLA